MIDDFAIEAFARDGAVVVRGLIGRSQIGELAENLDANRNGQSGASPHVVNSDMSDGNNEALSRIALQSKVSEVAATFMDSNTAIFHHGEVAKTPATGGHSGQRSDWTQDQALTNISGRAICAWVPLAEEGRTGSPQFWAGSHLGPLRLAGFGDNDDAGSQVDLAVQIVLDDAENAFSVSGLPDIVANPSMYDVRRWRLDVGDVIFYNSMIVRSAIESRTVNSLTLTYVAPDSVVSERPWPTLPDFGEVGELTAGAPFQGDLFPIAWNSASVLS